MNGMFSKEKQILLVHILFRIIVLEVIFMNMGRFINKIIQGDCLEVMKEIPDKSIDMVLCDLPYG